MPEIESALVKLGNGAVNDVLIPRLACLLVFLLLIASAIAVIYSSFQSRQLFGYLQEQSREALQLEEQWGRLLLEQSTWASHARIERLAKTQLHMAAPDYDAIIVVTQ